LKQLDTLGLVMHQYHTGSNSSSG